MTDDVENTFVCLFAICICVFQCPNLFDILYWVICFLIIDFWEFLIYPYVSPSIDICFTNIFFHSVACLVILLIVSFKSRYFKFWLESSLSICSFMDYAFYDLFKKYLPKPESQGFSLIFSFRCFIVLDFISHEPFELIFVRCWSTEVHFFDMDI